MTASRVLLQIRTERNASIAIAVMWVLILVTSIPAYMSHGEVSYNHAEMEHTSCVFLEVDPLFRPDGYNQPAYRVSTSQSLGSLAHPNRKQRVKFSWNFLFERSFYDLFQNTFWNCNPFFLFCGMGLKMTIK